jgi:hypothetical protein
MKKLFACALLLIMAFSGSAQNNAIGADDDFMNLLIQMGPELRAPKNIGSWPMLQNLDLPIDNKIAYKYLWQENKYVKEEDANCSNIGFMLNQETGVAVLFFFKGKADNLFFLIDVQTYNYKTGKLIDQLLSVAGFNDKGAACNMQINSFNEIVFKTLANGEENKIVLEISNKGKIKR